MAGWLRSRQTLILLVSFLAILGNNLVECRCNFPDEWEDHEYFRRYYDDEDSSASQWEMRRATYSENKAYWTTYDPDGDETSNIELTCMDNTEDEHTFTAVFKREDNDKYRCMSAITKEVCVFIQETSTSDDADVSSCINDLESISAAISIKYPFDFDDIDCPFPTGKYPVTYKSEDDECDGEVTIKEHNSRCTMEFDTDCSGRGSYEEPFDETLTFIETFDPDDYDENEDIAVFANSDSDHPLFYCARYKQTQRYLKMSLYVGRQSHPTCPFGDRYDTVDGNHVTFDIDLEETSAETSTASDATASTTKQDRGGGGGSRTTITTRESTDDFTGTGITEPFTDITVTDDNVTDDYDDDEEEFEYIIEVTLAVFAAVGVFLIGVAIAACAYCWSRKTGGGGYDDASYANSESDLESAGRWTKNRGIPNNMQ